MKSLFLLPSVALALASATAMAQNPAGGFKGPDTVKVITVTEALALPDDSTAKLQGYIVKSLGDEKYVFRDDSGTVTVEIDGDDWNGVEATPETRVELIVEVDRDWRQTVEFDVESVRLAP